MSRLTNTLKEVTEMLPTKTPKLKDNHYSKHTEQILAKRNEAIRNNNIEQFATLTKEFRKSKQADKKQYVIRSVTKDMDPRERWMGIKSMKAEYKPQPYHRKDKSGQTINTHKKLRKHLQSISRPFGKTPLHPLQPYQKMNLFDEVYMT